MKTLAYPTGDYDYTTYFKLEGFGDDAFSLLPDGPVIKADSPDYDADAVPHMDSLTPITNGEWVLIEDKEHVTVIDAAKDPEYPVRFILATSLPTFVMDGHGRLLINGHVLRDAGKIIFTDDLETPNGEYRLGRALRHAQIGGHIPADCEYALDDGGSLHKIDRAAWTALKTADFTVEIDNFTRFGYFEDCGRNDEEGCSGGLWFIPSDDGTGKLALSDYDGVFSLPKQVADALRDAGYDVSYLD